MKVKTKYGIGGWSGKRDYARQTGEQIDAQELPCKSVKAAVEAGFLPEVLNYQSLDKGI